MFVSPKTSITEFSGKTWFDRAFCQKNQFFKNKGPPRVFLVSLLVAPWAVPGLFIVRPRVSAIVQNVFGRYWCFAWSQLFSLNLSCDKLRYCHLTMLVKKRAMDLSIMKRFPYRSSTILWNPLDLQMTNCRRGICLVFSSWIAYQSKTWMLTLQTQITS